MADALKQRLKTVKKVKKCFQEDVSLKARADYLIEYLEDANDRSVFITENHQEIIKLIRDYFNHKCYKLKGMLIQCMIEKYNPGKPTPVKGPDTDRLFKCLEITQKIPIQVAADQLQDWEWDALSKINY
jgi:sulfur relay (sulfurtransferase) DsrC/TusE family protein